VLFFIGSGGQTDVGLLGNLALLEGIHTFRIVRAGWVGSVPLKPAIGCHFILANAVVSEIMSACNEIR
jgi:hypothetical protein